MSKILTALIVIFIVFLIVLSVCLAIALAKQRMLEKQIPEEIGIQANNFFIPSKDLLYFICAGRQSPFQQSPFQQSPFQQSPLQSSSHDPNSKTPDAIGSTPPLTAYGFSFFPRSPGLYEGEQDKKRLNPSLNEERKETKEKDKEKMVNDEKKSIGQNFFSTVLGEYDEYNDIPPASPFYTPSSSPVYLSPSVSPSHPIITKTRSSSSSKSFPILTTSPEIKDEGCFPDRKAFRSDSFVRIDID